MKLHDRNLSIRMRGDDVGLLQEALLQLKLTIPTDETTRKFFGKATRQAVLDFQKQHQLQATGVVDEATAVRIAADVQALQPPEGANGGQPASAPLAESQDGADRLARLKTERMPVPELAATLGLEVPGALLSRLAAHGIHTLADIRRAGGISRIEGLRGTAAEHVVRTLEAHAEFSVLSPDVQVNATLLKRGYFSASAIADAPQTDFVAAMRAQLGEFKAARLHVMARAQTHFLSHVWAGLQAEGANRYASATALGNGAMTTLSPSTCACKDCEAAVSPLAYLADLLDYTMKHLKQTSNGATLSARLQPEVTPARTGAVAMPRISPHGGTWANGKSQSGIVIVPPPTITPNGGTFWDPVTVKLAAAKSWAEIFYTLDGSTPDVNSTPYTDPITLERNTVLKAIVSQDATTSGIAQASFTINVAPPTITPNGGTFMGSVAVRLATMTLGAGIRYTLDGSTPNENSTAYTGPITLERNTVLKAIAFKGGMTPSGIAQASFTVNPVQYVATPTITPNSGAFLDSTAVWLATTTPGAQIRYTLNSSDPTSASTLYTSPIKVTSATTVKARAFKNGLLDSAVASASFTISSTPAPLPGRGLLGEYYNNSDLITDLKLVRTDATINFDWGTGAPDPSLDSETFSVRWTGRIAPRYSETYRFYAVSDDGIRVRVDGQLIIDNWTPQPPTEVSGIITLTSGKKYSIEVKYYDDGGGAVAMLLWSSPSQAKEVIPQSQLYPSLDLSFLADTFYQPLDALPASCASVEQQVRQVRICIEVLRGYLGAHPPTAPAQQGALATAEKAYRRAAYTTLLTQIGISFEEIRLGRTADEDIRKALADRLGIDLGPTRPDHLDALFLDPTAVPEVHTEQKLEELLGLRNTHRAPLTDAPTSSLQTWRLEHLRTLWKAQDWPSDPFAVDYLPVDGRLPIIDPDIIGPDDFRFPTAKVISNAPDKAFDIWLKRRKWVNDGLTDLKAKREASGLVFILKQVLGDPLPDLELLQNNLTTGTDLENTRKTITHDFHLTVESFIRLMALRTKNVAEVTAEEWQEVYSILMQAQKVAQFPPWISEERSPSLGLQFGPKEFWFSLREPKEGDWPPMPSAGRPLIDPDVLKLDDLPELTAGKRALALWEARRARLEQVNKDLKAEREAHGFDAMLRLALGHPNPGNALQYDLAALKNDLTSADPQVVASATKKITDDLHMTVEAFNRLMVIKDKDAQTDPLKKPTLAEYAEIYAILTQSRKIKHEYPKWIAEENDAMMGVVYWSALKAKLPRWGASVEARQAWQQALRTRSRASLIDPDLIGPGDLKNPVAGDPAFNLWDAHHTFVANQLTSLKTTREEKQTTPFILKWGSQGAGNGQFNTPGGVAVDLSGQVYVADTMNHRIQQFAASGAFLQKWGSQGTGDGQFNTPQAVTIDRNGSVYVADTGNRRIQQFAANGAFLQKWGSQGAGDGQFQTPNGVAVDGGGNIYVADAGNHRIQKFSANGVFLKKWGSQGTGDGQFNTPQAIAVDGSSNIYVADTGNHRIQKFDASGTFLRKWGSQGAGDGQFQAPQGVAVDSDGRVYVADTGNRRIQQFDANGLFQSRWGSLGTADGQFQSPRGVGVDRNGSAYVADSNIHRLQKFDVTNGLATILSTAGVPWQDLVALAEERKKGHDSTARLEQLSLDYPAFSYLLRICDLVVKRQPILPSEWDEVYSILTQVSKRREFAGWREAEKNLTLSPDFFRFPDEDKTIFPPPPPPWEPIPWRAVWEARRDWQDTLQARMDQERTIIEALQAAVSATEDATLSMLRDALLLATNAPGTTLDGKAKWITDHLLIDAKASGRQMTTRVAQAIETIQGLLWSVRTHQLTDTYPNIVLVAPDFTEAWEWIGSYATWRAAMFVFLYPENILLPSLRKWQTPAFHKLVSDLGANSRLTPEQARGAAQTYAAYYEDICRLTLEASCQTTTRTSAGERSLFYMFARGAATNAVCWSAYDPQDPTGYAQTFWEPVPGLNNVITILGAVPYAYDIGVNQKRRFICLFVRTLEKGVEKLVFARYDLEKQGWVGEPTELELPEKVTSFTAVVKQHERESYPLTLVIRVPSGAIYSRQLNKDGSDWAKTASTASNTKDDWHVVFTSAEASQRQYEAIHAMVGASEGDWWYMYDSYLFLSDRSGQIRYLYWDLQGAGTEGTLGQGNWVGAFAWPGGIPVYAFWRDGTSVQYKTIYGNAGVQGPWSAPGGGLARIAVHAGSVSPAPTAQFLAYQRADGGVYRSTFTRSGHQLIEDAVAPARIAPDAMPLAITEQLSEDQLRVRQLLSRQAFWANDPPVPRSNLIYVEEAFYFVPVYVALQLQRRGQYIAALDWLRTVYDYSRPAGDVDGDGQADRKIYYGLEYEESLTGGYERAENWLLDPLNPHAIAESRPYTYTRFTLLSLIRCLLEYADTEFTRDSAESLPRARTLYMTALELLESIELRQQENACDDLIATLDDEVRTAIQQEDPPWLPVWFELKSELATMPDYATLVEVIDDIRPVLANGPWSLRLANTRAIINQARAQLPTPPTIADVLQEKDRMLVKAYSTLLADPVISAASARVGAAAGRDFLHAVSTVSSMHTTTLERERVALPWLGSPLVTSTVGGSVGAAREPAVPIMMARGAGGLAIDARIAQSEPLLAVKSAQTLSTGYVPVLSYLFCIPPNPVLNALKLRAELNLYKLRNDCNIAGMERQLEPYAAPTDTQSGLPTIGAGGQLTLPGTTVLRPTPYRYKVLIERTKQLVQLAAQIEAAMLSALEKRDAEAYNLLKARQDVRLSRASIRLQDLRVAEAQGSIDLAKLQQEKAQLQFHHYETLLKEGESQTELNALEMMKATAGLHILAAVASADPKAAVADPRAAAASTISWLAAASSTIASALSTIANYERRKQDWEHQKNLAQQDVKIGTQQVTIAEDHVRVVGQERVIAEIQAEHAEAVVDFLSNKFTNVELYDWMGQVLEQVYSFFLQQATAMAKLAENQLAFERHETPPSFIQADYWEAPTDEMGGGTDGHAPDRRGLTGSARLLQDIYQLDQYAFETDTRKLQLTKTISLAQLAPAEFQRFRETGVMSFGTPMEMFDRDFPGHYLRLIKRVRTSVVALIPPTQGIKATFTTTGVSRVVIGGDAFQTVVVRRDPESVALTSPRDATGLFELEPQPEMRFPFEGMGTDTTWEFRMPRAANLFDYGTIADVSITLEYTALNSFDYQQQVIQSLPSALSADRPFSFRNQFADQWYDLHNPDQTPMPMTVRFTTLREDFPPNIADLKIQHIVLYFARANGKAFEVPVTHLHFTEQGSTRIVGGGATSMDGVISTRRGNAGSWTLMTGKAPVGDWELALPNTPDMRDLFETEEIEEILFVITYTGRTPAWPV